MTVFELAHEDPARLPQAAAIGIAAGVLLAAWGVTERGSNSTFADSVASPWLDV